MKPGKIAAAAVLAPPAHAATHGDFSLMFQRSGNGTCYAERVTGESLCEGGSCTPIPSHGGQQHYVRWHAEATEYRNW
ncbi:hypothetical protein [Amycolatopsis sp. NPDC051371]|uniref:hypothetical protein n=1 Tax=Amycolatopsis sp. NPDC051371 TaxID=3155800 RepID=UPI003448AC3E